MDPRELAWLENNPLVQQSCARVDHVVACGGSPPAGPRDVLASR
jgi:hypothetical protein